MRFMEALQGLIHPNTSNEATPSAVVVSKRTEISRPQFRALDFAPGAGFVEIVPVTGYFLEVSENGHTSIREVSYEVFQLNTPNRAFVKEADLFAVAAR